MIKVSMPDRWQQTMFQFMAVLLACSILILSLPANAADPARGKRLYWKCWGCHSMDRNRTGPMHCGLLGRKAGNVSGFQYSEAMKASGITWDQQTLDRFLANPEVMVPGTTMTYAGLDDAAKRADLISYLAQASRSEEFCGTVSDSR